MRRTRDVFYVEANFNENYYIFYGMEFKEFIKCNPLNLENILITDGCYLTDSYNRDWSFEVARGREEILKLSTEDIYGLGDFRWIDYDNEENLNNCTPEERAEILYLSHFGEPLKSPFLNRINNHFVYIAHDDGWFCKLYCKDMSVFKEIVANKIIECFSTNKRRKIYPMDETIKNQILELTDKGLLLDFSNVFSHDKYIGINYYVIGHYRNMDEMYNNLKRNKQTANLLGHIEHTNKKWKIESWQR